MKGPLKMSDSLMRMKTSGDSFTNPVLLHSTILEISMRTPVINHNLLNSHRNLETFFSKCASGKKLGIAAKLVSVAQFV